LQTELSKYYYLLFSVFLLEFRKGHLLFDAVWHD